MPTDKSGNYFALADHIPSAAYLADLERAAPSDAIAKATASIDNLAEVERRIARLESLDSTRLKDETDASV